MGSRFSFVGVWLAAVLVTVVCVAAPEIVRDQIHTILCGSSVGDWPIPRSAAERAAVRAEGYRPRLAYAVACDSADPSNVTASGAGTPASWPRTRALLALYPSSPGLVASLLRHQFDSVRTDDTEPRLLEGRTIRGPGGRINLAYINQMIAETHTGERLDPANAFFPFARAALLYGSGRDAEGSQAILSASDDPHWNDYLSDEVQGERVLTEGEWGIPGSISDSLIYNAIYLPYLAYFNDAARCAAYNAMLLEQQHRYREALHLRIGTMRVGGLMWSEPGAPAVVALTGAAVTGISIDRPGGAQFIKAESNSDSEVWARKTAAMDGWLSASGQAEARPWIDADLSRADQIHSDMSRQRVRQETDRVIRNVFRVYYWWAASAVMLASATGFILLGTVARNFHPDSSDKGMPAPLRGLVNSGVLLFALVLTYVFVRLTLVPTMTLDGIGNYTTNFPAFISMAILPAAVPWVLCALLVAAATSAGFVGKRSKPKTVDNLPAHLGRWCAAAALLATAAYACATIVTGMVDRRVDTQVSRANSHEAATIEAALGKSMPEPLPLPQGSGL